MVSLFLRWYSFNGIITIISTLGWLVVAFGLYKYYQMWDMNRKLGGKAK